MEITTILAVNYLAGVACVAYAGERRTIGMFGAGMIALLASPIVGAILLLAWPTRQDAERYHMEQADKAKAGLK